MNCLALQLQVLSYSLLPLQLSRIASEHVPQYISKPFVAALGKLKIFSSPNAVQWIVPGFLNLFHPKNKENYISGASQYKLIQKIIKK